MGDMAFRGETLSKAELRNYGDAPVFLTFYCAFVRLKGASHGGKRAQKKLQKMAPTALESLAR